MVVAGLGARAALTAWIGSTVMVVAAAELGQIESSDGGSGSSAEWL